jgi:hypothetical protein
MTRLRSLASIILFSVDKSKSIKLESPRKFLPYGDSARPYNAAGWRVQPSVAVVTGVDLKNTTSNDAQLGGTIVQNFEIENGDAKITLLKCVESTVQPVFGIEIFPIDAGPFENISDAIGLIVRWRDDYYNCHRTNEGSPSCFEFGGCHKQCWWREEKPHRIVDTWFVGSMKNFDFRHDDIGSYLKRQYEGDPTSPNDFHRLVGTIVSVRSDLFFCSLRRVVS